nr:YegP family protein [Arthrobacter sp. C9C5]
MEGHAARSSGLAAPRAVVFGPAAPAAGKSTEGAPVAGKFEVYKDKSGGYRFRLKAGNGEVIASSESYKSKASALNGVESVKKNADAAVVDVTEES